MTTLAFDTHRAVKALCEAGAAEPLAEAVVATVGDAIAGDVATKADIAEVRTEIAQVQTETAQVRTEIAQVRAELKAEIGGLEARLYRHLWMMAAGIVGLTVTLVKLLG